MPISIWSIVIPTFVMYIVCGIVYPNIYGQTLQLFTGFTGLAGSLFGSLLIIITSIVSALASLLHTQNQLPMASLWLGIALLLLIGYFALFSRKEESDID